MLKQGVVGNQVAAVQFALNRTAHAASGPAKPENVRGSNASSSRVCDAPAKGEG
jgi:hypothetical protein